MKVTSYTEHGGVMAFSLVTLKTTKVQELFVAHNTDVFIEDLRTSGRSQSSRKRNILTETSVTEVRSHEVYGVALQRVKFCVVVQVETI